MRQVRRKQGLHAGGRVTTRASGPRGPACSPCFLRTCRIAERYLCLRAIAPEDALEALA